MRLATFREGNSKEDHVGIVEGASLREFRPSESQAPSSSLLDVIVWNQSLELSGSADPSASPRPIDSVTMRAPIPRPPTNVICLGRNYAEHAIESARARGEEVARPTFFTKAVTSIIGPYDDIPFDPNLSTEIDWEAELGVVIGRKARSVSVEDALDYVFGYTVVNDVSARDLQHDYGGQFFYGKSLDGSCPIGPWIVTADEVLDPQDLRIQLRVDGVVKQDDSTRNMIFSVAECIAILSRAMTLLPGTIISTGTPSGVGFAREPMEYLRPGNVMETEVEGVGTLRNTVVQVT